MTDLQQALKSSSQKIKSWDDVVHIGYFNGPDQIIAASLIGKALLSIEHPFTIFPISTGNIEFRGLDRNYVIVGGSEHQAEEILELKELVWIPQPSDLIEDDDRILNVIKFGITGDDICLSTTSYLISLEISSAIGNLIHLPLVARQCINMKALPDQKWHKLLYGKAKEEGFITERDTITVFGADLFNIVETLTYSTDPFFPNLQNDEDRIQAYLRDLDIEIETNEGPRKFSQLNSEELKKLYNKLLIDVSVYPGYKEGKLNFFGKKALIDRESDYPVLSNTWDFARAILDGINLNKHSVIVSVLLGNRGRYLSEFTKIYRNEREKLVKAIKFLRSDEIEELKNLRFLKVAKNIDWFNASPLASMSLASGVATIDLPFGIITDGPDSLATVAVKASKNLNFKLGLDEIVSLLPESFSIQSTMECETHSLVFSIAKDQAEEVLIELSGKIGEVNEVQD